MSELKVGKVVNIYHDPVNCENFEGLAELLGYTGTKAYQQEYWHVKFVDDGFITDRWVNTVKY